MLVRSRINYDLLGFFEVLPTFWKMFGCLGSMGKPQPKGSAATVFSGDMSPTCTLALLSSRRQRSPRRPLCRSQGHLRTRTVVGPTESGQSACWRRMFVMVGACFQASGQEVRDHLVQSPGKVNQEIRGP